MVWIIVAFYLAPTLVAGFRRHRNGVAIFALNLLLGWTFLGWVVALVWSCTDNTRPRRGDRVSLRDRDRREVVAPMRVVPEQLEGESDAAFAARVRAMRASTLARR